MSWLIKKIKGFYRKRKNRNLMMIENFLYLDLDVIEDMRIKLFMISQINIYRKNNIKSRLKYNQYLYGGKNILG
jgi:hypothetical protein